MEKLDLDRLVVFDLETTGLDSDCRIVQIAMIRGDGIYQSLVNPGIPIPPESTEIHKITDKDVAGKPAFKDIADDVLDYLKDCVVTGYNIRKFDLPVLKREVRRAGREFPPLPVIDLFELNQKMNPRSLAWFYQHYTGEKMDAGEAHDAVYDCICTRKGLLGMFDKHEELPSDLMALSKFAEPDRIPAADSEWLAWTEGQCEPSFTRGKYRGWALSEVARKEPSYMNWLLSIDSDSATKNLLNLYKKDRAGYVAVLRREHPLRLEPRYLEFRQDMDRNDEEAYKELVVLARETKDPSLVFLSAVWAKQGGHDEAGEFIDAYLCLKDPNVNAEKRKKYLEDISGKLPGA